MKEDKKGEENLDNYTKNKVEKGIKDLMDEKELKIKWRKELDENESVRNYFESFNPSTIPSFIDQYLNQKYNAFKYGDSFAEHAETRRSKWIVEAHEQLEAILQKQLFDIQCRWRAEQLQLEGIEICFDFEVWEQDIFNCPFLEPISKGDIRIYQDFLTRSDPDREALHDGDWQNYMLIKDAYSDAADEDDMTIPEWYEFHNARTGNGSLLLLPDTRGEKELFYMQLKNVVVMEEQAKTVQKAAVNTDQRPHIRSYDTGVLDFFVSTFEDADSKRKYQNYTHGNGSMSDDAMDYHDLVYDMASENEVIPIEANFDFKIALELAYNKYSLKKIAENLPYAHEQYLFNKEMNISSAPEDNFKIGLRELYLKRILDGRELNGEARNLDF